MPRATKRKAAPKKPAARKPTLKGFNKINDADILIWKGDEQGYVGLPLSERDKRQIIEYLKEDAKDGKQRERNAECVGPSKSASSLTIAEEKTIHHHHNNVQLTELLYSMEALCAKFTGKIPPEKLEIPGLQPNNRIASMEVNNGFQVDLIGRFGAVVAELELSL